jgi:hypothetical protein
VTLNSAIFKSREPPAVNRAAPVVATPIMCHYFHGAHDRGP